MVGGGWLASVRTKIHYEGQVCQALGAIVVKTTVASKEKGALTFVIAQRN